MTYAVRFSPNILSDLKRGWSGWMHQSWESLNSWWNSSTGDAAKAAWEALQARREKEKYQEFDTPMQYILQIYQVDSIEQLDWVDVSNELEQLIGQDLRWDEGCSRWRLCHHDGLSVWVLESQTLEEARIEAVCKYGTDANGINAVSGHRTIGKVEIVETLPFKIQDQPVYLLKVQGWATE